MGNIYLSFLGLGTYDEQTGEWLYNKGVYELNEVKSSETEFVQVAEMEILGPDRFDKIVIVATQKSYETHFENLEAQLQSVGASNVLPVIIDEDMSPQGQWCWFEKILDQIGEEDALTVDLTHGYRSIPIVFSTAINFLQKAKGITLDAVYYGAYEKDRRLSPIVDMKQFYAINDWADAVSRLAEDADAGKLATVAATSSGYQVEELNDAELLNGFRHLTNMIRNVDVNNTGAKANEVMKTLEEKQARASVTGKILLELLMKKFSSLSTDDPPSGLYDREYFRLQLELSRLLLEHELFMQAYTVMRELIGSIGMIEVERARLDNSDGRKRRRRFAEVFVNMLQFDPDEWWFKDQAEMDRETLMPYYEKLRGLGIEHILRSFTKELASYRNGFDHAWTLKARADMDVEEKGKEFHKKLTEVIHLLDNNSVLD